MIRPSIISLLSVLCTTLLFGACDVRRDDAAAIAPSTDADLGYVTPPSVTSVARVGSVLNLEGRASPTARVRLANPGGQAMEASADKDGQWRMTLEQKSEAAIYGLSQRVGGRTLQAEGYVLVTPAGQAVLLRAGAGALSIGAAPRVGLTAIDVDRDGGAVVSGRTTVGGFVGARVDGRPVGDGKADAAGRFSLSLTGPLAPGRHGLKVVGDGLNQVLSIDATPAAPLRDGPFRAKLDLAGLRVDWMTPGGGVQTTLILTQVPEAAAP